MTGIVQRNANEIDFNSQHITYPLDRMPTSTGIAWHLAPRLQSTAIEDDGNCKFASLSTERLSDVLKK